MSIVISKITSIDSDALAFINAASINDSTQINAINYLVNGLKYYNLWSKMKAIYPFVGGTALTHKWNLKDPRDLDAAFRLTFGVSITHSNNGIIGTNNSSSFANSNFIPANNLTLNSEHLSFYSVINHNQSGDSTDIGAYNSVTQATVMASKNAITGGIVARMNSITMTVANADARGFYMITKNGDTTAKIYKNNQNVLTTNNSSGSLPTKFIYIGAAQVANGSAFQSVAQTYAFASIGDGLTDTNALNLYNVVQNYQQLLNRQVNSTIPYIDVFPERIILYNNKIISEIIDSDAQLFINAAGLTNSTQISAINYLVNGLKYYSIWSKMKAIYPFVGGTAFTHKWNLKDPRDLDVAFRLTFFGNFTHSSTGCKGDGSTAFANTFLANNIMAQNSLHLSLYSRTNYVNGTITTDIGAWVSGFSSGIYLYSNGLTRFMLNTSVSAIISSTSTLGFFMTSRLNATEIIYNINGSSGTLSSPSTQNKSDQFIIWKPGNYSGEFSPREFAFVSIGDGLSDTDALNLYNIVQQYQTTLNRQVT